MTFPIDAAYLDARARKGSTWGLEDDVSDKESDGGVSEVNPRWPRPKRSWLFSWQRKESADAVETMFEVCGNRRGFLLIPKRQRDYIATDQVIGTGDGATTVFRLKLTRTNGVTSVSRNILRPLSSPDLTMKLDSTPLLSGFTVNYATARVTFDTAPALGVLVKPTFQYAWAVKFKSNKIDTIVHHENNQEMSSVTLEEVFEDET